jgi:hypothetical protein
MEEQVVQPQPEKKMNKKMILSLVVIIIVLVIIALEYGQIIAFLGVSNKETILDQPTCQARMDDWCNQCLSANNGRKDFWNLAGTQVGEDLAACSNKYFGTDMPKEQDCTGKALVYCSSLLGLQVE